MNEVKYCVTAMIDLLGFSTHLEVGAYDVRTNIGQQAMERLQCLENAIELLFEERDKFREYYPDFLHVIRLNDAIFMTIDLSDFLTPSVGNLIRRGTSGNELQQIFSEEELKDEQTFISAYNKKIYDAIEPLTKFVGIASRVHSYIQNYEKNNHFPGVKTVIATGFRKRFFNKKNEEDRMSANFSLSNAYLAESQLKGANFYVDNYLLQMLSVNRYTKNIIRFASFILQENIFHPMEEYEDIFYLSGKYDLPQPIQISLFKRNFTFRQMTPNVLSFLQIIPNIMPYLVGEKERQKNDVFEQIDIFEQIFQSIQRGFLEEYLKEKKKPSYLLHNIKNDIEESIGTLQELIEGKPKVEPKEISVLSRLSY